MGPGSDDVRRASGGARQAVRPAAIPVPPAQQRPPAPSAPARQKSLRHHNLGLVLRHVVGAPGPVSRADVAAATGLTRATVSALVERLLQARLVAELPPLVTQRAGRPAVPLVPAPGAVAAVGLEINVDYLGVRVLDLTGAVLAEEVERGDFRRSDPAAVLARLVELDARVTAPLQGVRLVGAALALPGLVDRRTGPLRIAPNLGWRDVDVLALLPPGARRPWLGNEANLAARAESRARRGTDVTSFVYVSGEVGIGAAVVLDGALLPGRHGWGGEIGHLAVGTAGSFADGGSLESYAGQDAILDAVGLPRTTTADELRDRADRGDEDVRAALQRAGSALGVALAAVVNVVDVEHVVLGGTHAVLADHLRGPVVEQLRRRVISAPWLDVGVDVAAAGSYPALTGGALAVLQAVLDDPVGSGVLGEPVEARTAPG